MFFWKTRVTLNWMQKALCNGLLSLLGKAGILQWKQARSVTWFKVYAKNRLNKQKAIRSSWLFEHKVRAKKGHDFSAALALKIIIKEWLVKKCTFGFLHAKVYTQRSNICRAIDALLQTILQLFRHVFMANICVRAVVDLVWARSDQKMVHDR